MIRLKLLAHDIDSNRPRIPNIPPRAYWRIKNSSKRFEFILKNFNFLLVRDIFYN